MSTERASHSWECGICWQVYDPQVGDERGQVPAGTPFEELLPQWCCPNCEAPKYKFMMLTDR